MPEKKKITRKVISTHPSSGGKPPAKEADEVVEKIEAESQKEVKAKRGCFFCQNKSTPTYTDLAVLRRFITDRAKILPKLRSNVCSKHQRAVAKNVKYARHLALLPFVPKV